MIEKWLGSEKHEAKMDSLQKMAARYACRAKCWEPTATLAGRLPKMKETISQQCYRINSKWLEKNREHGAVASTIKNAKIGKEKPSRGKFVLNTPLYHLDQYNKRSV